MSAGKGPRARPRTDASTVWKDDIAIDAGSDAAGSYVAQRVTKTDALGRAFNTWYVTANAGDSYFDLTVNGDPA